MSTRYFEVLEEFALHVGVDSTKEFLEEQELMIERTVVGFLWEGDEENGDIIFFIRLGAPGAARLQEIAIQLLEANYLAAGVGGSTIGVHHDSGEVVISSSINAHGLTGEGLAGVIGGFLDTAAQWEGVVKGQAASTEPTSGGSAAPEALTDLQRISMGLRA